MRRSNEGGDTEWTTQRSAARGRVCPMRSTENKGRHARRSLSAQAHQIELISRLEGFGMC
eukprot:1625317-Pleurochrysis_carterae.AAC.4